MIRRRKKEMIRKRSIIYSILIKVVTPAYFSKSRYTPHNAIWFVTRWYWRAVYSWFEIQPYMRLFIHCTPLTQIDDIHYVTGWSVKTPTRPPLRASGRLNGPISPSSRVPPHFPMRLSWAHKHQHLASCELYRYYPLLIFLFQQLLTRFPWKS